MHHENHRHPSANISQSAGWYRYSSFGMHPPFCCCCSRVQSTLRILPSPKPTVDPTRGDARVLPPWPEGRCASRRPSAACNSARSPRPCPRPPPQRRPGPAGVEKLGSHGWVKDLSLSTHTSNKTHRISMHARVCRFAFGTLNHAQLTLSRNDASRLPFPIWQHCNDAGCLFAQTCG